MARLAMQCGESTPEMKDAEITKEEKQKRGKKEKAGHCVFAPLHTCSPICKREFRNYCLALFMFAKKERIPLFCGILGLTWSSELNARFPCLLFEVQITVLGEWCSSVVWYAAHFIGTDTCRVERLW